MVDSGVSHDVASNSKRLEGFGYDDWYLGTQPKN